MGGDALGRLPRRRRDDLWERSYGDTGVPVAGPGAPLVAEFSVAEFAAALGLSTDAGRGLPRRGGRAALPAPAVWARVTAADLAAWKARRIARATIALTREAAAFVDAPRRQVAQRSGPYQLDRLVEEAIARFMPDEAEKRRRAAADGRRFDVDTRDTSLAGTAHVWGELDLADALDLDAAVAAGAEQLKALGSHRLARRTPRGRGGRARPAPADPRPRPTDDGDATTGRRQPRRKTRQVVLYAHLSDEAITDPRLGDLGRLENTRSLITAEQVRTWCGNPDAQVVVKPVIDLDDHVHVTPVRGPRPDGRGRGLADARASSRSAPAPRGAAAPTSTTPTATTSRPRPRRADLLAATSRRCAAATTG